MNSVDEFEQSVAENISRQGGDRELLERSFDYMRGLDRYYTYNFKWMGRPIIQMPQDIVAMQELIWKVKPDLIIETGIAHGGSLILYSSLLDVMGIESGHVLGIDIDIRQHNRIEIEKHPMAKRITMFEGSSVSEEISHQVHEFAKNYHNIMVVLDSNHTHEHVAMELKLYNDLVSLDSYCVVFDTVIEDMPEDFYPDRPWGKGDNPKTAVWEFIRSNPCFEIDKSIQHKLLLTVSPDGFLKRTKQ